MVAELKSHEAQRGRTTIESLASRLPLLVPIMCVLLTAICSTHPHHGASALELKGRPVFTHGDPPPSHLLERNRLHRNFFALNRHRTAEELETVRVMLSSHRQRMAERWPTVPPSLGRLAMDGEGNFVRAEEQRDRESGEQSGSNTGVANHLVLEIEEPSVGGGSTADSSFIQKRSPEIIHLNRALRDYLYQGDMALTAEQANHLLLLSTASATTAHDGAFSRRDAAGKKRRRRRQALNPATFSNFRWNNGSVPYTLDTSLQSSTRALIREAMNFWEKNTCVSFIEVPSTSHGEEGAGQKSKLQIFKGDGCWSYVGKIYVWDSQEVSIGDGCEHFGVITHELAHALGFFHAQSRFDRDSFITFNAANVQNGFEDQFGKESLDTNRNFEVTYDYGSVMHYSEVAFAREENKPVLLAKEPHNQNTMGQRIRPSFSDVLVMNRYYGCLDRCSPSQPSTAKCTNGGYPAPRDCSTCICPWGFGGPLCADRQTASNGTADCGATLNAVDKWQELNAMVGEPTKELKPTFASCYWHIAAEDKTKKVELRVLQAGRVCSAGCFYGNLEIKLGNDWGRTGMRMCCAKDVKEKPVLKSEGSLAVIGLYSRFFTQHVKLQYRQV